MGSHPARRGRAALAAILVLVVGIGAAATAAASGPSAHASRRVLHVNDSASLHLTRKSGNVLNEAGRASGSLPGSVTATFNISHITRVTGTVTFHSGAGSITMTAVGYPSSTGTVVPFSGSIAVRSGTGRYRAALGSGRFSGSVSRRTWSVRIRSVVATVTY